MDYLRLTSHYTPKTPEIQTGDFYVSKNGNDAWEGTPERPFLTIERAQRAARALGGGIKPVTVCVEKGLYRTNGLVFDERDSYARYTARGDGEVVLEGGIPLKPDDFIKVPDELAERVNSEARDKIYVADLKKYGLSEKDWGPLYPIGMFGTEKSYDSYVPGSNAELFFGGERMVLARYPNEGFLQLSDVNYVGDVAEFPAQNYYPEWYQKRNPKPGVYIMDKETTRRVEKWKDKSTCWTYGFFMWDWADSSAPVTFDCAHRSMFPAYVSKYGACSGANYYLYNVLEELDAPGEWYLDRKEGLLYFYPPKPLGEEEVTMSITTNPIVSGKNVHHLSLEGFTLRGTRADAIHVQGNDNLFKGLTVLCVMGDGISVDGYRNRIVENDVSRTGKSGVRMRGGDRENLIPAENIAENNYVHAWAQVFKVYQPAFAVHGIGSTVSHNEIRNGYHAAIYYYGNDHLLEYNVIHNVVRLSTDAGAIYSGQDPNALGTVIRYNLLLDVGEAPFEPDGIYFDDMLSGQTAYGNILVNVRKNAFLIGGGRDHQVYGNLIIGAGLSGIKYDDRARDGLLNNGWAKQSVSSYEDGVYWKRLRAIDYQKPDWAARYPQHAAVSHDFDNYDAPEFALNPAGSSVHDNVMVACPANGLLISESVLAYSDFAGNPAYESLEAAGINEDLTLAPGAACKREAEGFEPIPIHKIGRY